MLKEAKASEVSKVFEEFFKWLDAEETATVVMRRLRHEGFVIMHDPDHKKRADRLAK